MLLCPLLLVTKLTYMVKLLESWKGTERGRESHNFSNSKVILIRVYCWFTIFFKTLPKMRYAFLNALTIFQLFWDDLVLKAWMHNASPLGSLWPEFDSRVKLRLIFVLRWSTYPPFPKSNTSKCKLTYEQFAKSYLAGVAQLNLFTTSRVVWFTFEIPAIRLSFRQFLSFQMSLTIFTVVDPRE